MKFDRRSLLKLLPNIGAAGFISYPVNRSTEFLKPSKNTASAGADIYTALGVKPLINARGTVTIVGATRMLSEVKEAMDAATQQYVQIDELMDAAGQRLAKLTGAEWGCVTSGASAAITFGTLACVTGGDPDKLWQVPNLHGMKDEVIIPSYSRTAYECAARSVGVRMIEVSNLAELKHAIGPRTAMILVLTGSRSAEGELSIREMAKVANPYGIPILADAAAEELVVPNPHLAQGADMVAYSGGKCLRGPQCAGLLIGRKDLVKAASMCSAPHHGYGRGHKVGREEIIGMLTAVEMWFKRDHEEENRQWTHWLKQIADKIRDLPGIAWEITQPGSRLSNRFPGLQVKWDTNIIPLTGYDLENILWNGEPRIAVSGAGSFLPFPPNMQPNIQINPSQLAAGEERIIADRLYEVLSNPPKMKEPSGSPAADLTGEWNLQMEFSASSADQTLVLQQVGNILSGTHYAFYAARNLTGSIYGTTILIRSSYTENGVRLNFEFSGEINGERMSGKVSLGEYGMARWSAERKKF